MCAGTGTPGEPGARDRDFRTGGRPYTSPIFSEYFP
jgi:hypothetical protein